MLHDRQMFRNFEKALFLMRWAIIFVIIFSLDTTIYAEQLFEKLCIIIFWMATWNVCLYITVQKLEQTDKYQDMIGIVESVIDIFFIVSIAVVLRDHTRTAIYSFFLLLSVVIYVRYLYTYKAWLMQVLILVTMYGLHHYVYKMNFILKNTGFLLSMASVLLIGILFYFVNKEYGRLEYLVDQQSNRVKGLSDDIKEITNLTEMNQVIFESESKEHILSNLLDHVQKVTKDSHVSLFLYGENGVESDAKLYQYSVIKNHWQTEELPYEVMYHQKEMQRLRSRREYRYCILNYEPIISTYSSDQALFSKLLGGELETYIYLFNMINQDENAGILICNVDQRMPIESCKNIARMVENAGIALAKASQIEKAKDKSIYDALTGVKSRGSINETLPIMMQRAKERQTSLGALFIDIDGFKKFNDTYHHRVGDIVLRKVADTLMLCAPQESLVGRYGGEEFLVVVQDRDQQETLELAQEIRTQVAQIDLESVVGINVQITVSIGVARYPNHTRDIDLLIEYADQAMYEAKKEKNTVCIYQPCKCKEDE